MLGLRLCVEAQPSGVMEGRLAGLSRVEHDGNLLSDRAAGTLAQGGDHAVTQM